MSASPLELEALFVRIYANADQLFASTKKVEAEVSRLVKVLNAALTGLTTAAIYAFNSFDQAMTRSLAHMREFALGTFSDMRMAMEKGIFDIAIKTTTGVTDLAKGFDVLVSSGQSAGMALKSLAIAETFAVAGGMDMEKATRKLVEIQRALGLESSDVAVHYAGMTHLADAFVGLAPQVGSTTEQLSSAFSGRLMSTMRQFNLTFEDTLALVGSYSRLGAEFKGAHGGQMLERAIRELASETAIPGRELQFGFKAYDASNNLKPLIQLVEEFAGKLRGLAPAEQKAYLEQLHFQDNIRSTVIPLIQSSVAASELRKEIDKLGGSSQMVAEMVRRSLSGQLTNLWKNITTLATAIGKYLAPAIYYLAEGLRNLTSWFINLNPAVQSLLVLVAAHALSYRLGLIGAAFKAIGIVLSPLLIPFRMLSSLLGGLGSLFVGSVGMVLSGLSQITALAWSSFWGIFRLSRVILTSFIGALAHPITTITGLFSSMWSGLVSGFKYIIASIIPLIVNLLSFVMALVTSFFALAGIITVVATIAVGIGQVISAVGVGLKNYWTSIREQIPGLFVNAAERAVQFGESARGVWENLKEDAADYFDFLVLGIERVAGFFWHFGDNVIAIFRFLRENWREVAFDIGRSIVVLIENTIANVRVLFSAVSSVASILWEPISLSFGRLVREIGIFFGSQWRNMLSDIGVVTKAFFRSLLENFKIVIEGMTTMLKGSDFLDAWTTLAAKAYTIARSKPGEDISAKLAEVDRIMGGAYQLRQKAADPIELGKRLKGPADYLNTKELTTDFSRSLEGFAFIGRALMRRFGAAMGKAGGAWSEGTEGLINPMAGFEAKAPWMKLFDSIKTALPEDWGKKMEEYLKVLTGQAGAGGEAGQLRGSHGPGFRFQQISESRFAIGGPGYETVEWQQLTVLRSIDAKLAAAARAAERQEPREKLKMPTLISE